MNSVWKFLLSLLERQCMDWVRLSKCVNLITVHIILRAIYCDIKSNNEILLIFVAGFDIDYTGDSWLLSYVLKCNNSS